MPIVGLVLLLSLTPLASWSRAESSNAWSSGPAGPGHDGKASGRVRADGGVLVDDRGPFLALGASLFWALWGERHDPDRLDRNLKWLADRQFDYVRIFGMVGAETWSDRVIDPAAADYWTIVDRLFARLAQHGLRAQVTVFADAQVMMPDLAARGRFADAWAAYAERHAPRVLLLETANEYALNGFDAAQVRALTRRMNERTSVLVAASTPSGLWPQIDFDSAGPDDRALIDEWQTLYSGGVADALTFHADRDTGKTGGTWRPVRELWKLQYAGGEIPRVWINSEPIGPQSSVAEDDDPVRLAMAAAMSWVSGMAAYTLHTGAGVRGGGAVDVERGRAANFWELPRLDETARMLRGVKSALPAEVPNWRRVNWHHAGHPCLITRQQAERELSAHVAAVRRDRFVLLSFGQSQPLECRSQASGQAVALGAPFTSPRTIALQSGKPAAIDAPAQLVIK